MFLDSNRDWEFQSTSDNGETVAGKIHQKSEFWEDTLNAPNYVTNIIKYGYSLPFVETCKPFFAENNASSLKHPDFVEEAISKLLKQKCIMETKEIPYCCNPLTVAESSKLRLVLDLRHVNPCLEKHSFKYENLKIFPELFEQGYYFSSYDLKSGYHHVSINEAHWQYLGFSWVHKDGIRRYYIFIVMPFGLSTACFVFTKLLRPLIKKWRSQGYRIIGYLDDGIFGDKTEKLTRAMCQTIIGDLTLAGFTINAEKSILQPTQQGIWLGFLIDTKSFTLTVPECKIKDLISEMTKTVTRKTTTARKIARIAGKIISMGPAIGPLSRLFTRKMFKLVDVAGHWDQPTVLDAETRIEIEFWLKNINSSNGYRIKPNHAITKIVFSDASNHSFGGFIINKMGNVIAHDSSTPNEVAGSSTLED